MPSVFDTEPDAIGGPVWVRELTISPENRGGDAELCASRDPAFPAGLMDHAVSGQLRFFQLESNGRVLANFYRTSGGVWYDYGPISDEARLNGWFCFRRGTMTYAARIGDQASTDNYVWTPSDENEGGNASHADFKAAVLGDLSVTVDFAFVDGRAPGFDRDTLEVDGGSSFAVVGGYASVFDTENIQARPGGPVYWQYRDSSLTLSSGQVRMFYDFSIFGSSVNFGAAGAYRVPAALTDQVVFTDMYNPRYMPAWIYYGHAGAGSSYFFQYFLRSDYDNDDYTSTLSRWTVGWNPFNPSIRDSIVTCLWFEGQPADADYAYALAAPRLLNWSRTAITDNAVIAVAKRAADGTWSDATGEVAATAANFHAWMRGSPSNSFRTSVLVDGDSPEFDLATLTASTAPEYLRTASRRLILGHSAGLRRLPARERIAVGSVRPRLRSALAAPERVIAATGRANLISGLAGSARIPIGDAGGYLQLGPDSYLAASGEAPVHGREQDAHLVFRPPDDFMEEGADPGFPPPMRDGIIYSPIPHIAHSGIQGDVRQRRLSRSGTRRITSRHLCTRQQRALFFHYWEQTLKHGSLKFPAWWLRGLYGTAPLDQPHQRTHIPGQYFGPPRADVYSAPGDTAWQWLDDPAYPSPAVPPSWIASGGPTAYAAEVRLRRNSSGVNAEIMLSEDRINGWLDLTRGIDPVLTIPPTYLAGGSNTIQFMQIIQGGRIKNSYHELTASGYRLWWCFRISGTGHTFAVRYLNADGFSFQGVTEAEGNIELAGSMAPAAFRAELLSGEHAGADMDFALVHASNVEWGDEDALIMESRTADVFADAALTAGDQPLGGSIHYERRVLGYPSQRRMTGQAYPELTGAVEDDIRLLVQSSAGGDAVDFGWEGGSNPTEPYQWDAGADARALLDRIHDEGAVPLVSLELAGRRHYRRDALSRGTAWPEFGPSVRSGEVMAVLDPGSPPRWEASRTDPSLGIVEINYEAVL